MQQTFHAYSHIILLCLCWYIISSFASQVTKKILTIHPLPLFLGEFQFAYTAFLACICCMLANEFPSFYRRFPEGTFPQYHDESHPRYQRNTFIRPTKHLLLTLLPLSLFQFVGKYFGHMATSLVPISTVASVKTLSPVCIIIIQKFFDLVGPQLGGHAYVSLACIILGVWIIVSEDSRDTSRAGLVAGAKDSVEYSSYGIVCAVSSMLIFAAQNVYGKGVFTYKQENSNRFDKAVSPLPIYMERKGNVIIPESIKYDKLTLMLYISLVGFSLSFGWFMTWEYSTIYNEITQIGFGSIPWKLLFLNGTFHFLQAMIAYQLLGEVSTLTYSIANIMKRIVVITVSWVVSSRRITANQLLGLLLNMVGLFLYERYNSKRKKVQRKTHLKNKI
ncbi:YJL193W [Zygosaccharomyces parabailii]|nr:YJL193W [Zygosaccharomyces parabailii]CDH12437.1 related to Similarity to transporter of the triose phosphate translocator family protein, Sly41p [Zygosaccharomyces bailii ISA1307]